ncbi:Remorin [Thalictrum thalictroides]|uniref:Remorin n=1 Tax=Thalictrum thalictroides TaxID=46969 RepID=A0A7J6WH16_THATH|nr:Remorin [Thalictrum thalictroides]
MEEEKVESEEEAVNKVVDEPSQPSPVSSEPATPAASVLEKDVRTTTPPVVSLQRLETKKKSSLIKAWEESEKTRAENKAERTLAKIASWENRKKASLEVQLKKFEEKLENKRSAYIEKMKNKIAIIHKEADEQRAFVEAKKGEQHLKVEEVAAKHRAANNTPKKKKNIGCFGKKYVHVYLHDGNNESACFMFV